MANVTFIGLGNMGGPMARNLTTAGHQVIACDLDAAKVQAVVAVGGIAGDSVATAVAEAEFVLTSLPGPSQIRSLANELIPSMARDAVWVDLSTNDLDCTREIAALAAEYGIRLVDAPVTGGAEGAEAGTLSVLCGGDEETFDRVSPVLHALGARVDLLGPHGAGYVAKIASVSLCYLQAVCLTEALLLGTKGGVAPDKMLDIIRHSTGRSYVADRYGPEILNGGYDETFDLGLAHKDLRLAMEMAGTVSATLPFMQSVADFYESSVERHGAEAPHLIAMQDIEQANNLILSEFSAQEPT